MAETTETPNGSIRAKSPEQSRSREANWPAVLFFIHIHLLSLYGLWLVFFEIKWLTLILFVTLTTLAILGVTAGAHRLWAHRTYKASTGLRIFLMLCQTLAGHGTIYDWVLYHRLHHAHHATEDDPYDHRRGFLYAHMMTRLKKLSPHQQKLMESIDMTDLEKDVVVTVQRTIYWVLYGVFFILLPLNAPLEYWGESIISSVFVIGFLRYGVVLHASWLVESAMLVWGLKQGEKYPSDSNAVFLIDQNFWPQYHYLLPQDYKSGEYGTYDNSCATSFIRVCAALDLATNLQTVETATIQAALANAAKTKSSFEACLENAVKKQHLPEEHYLKRG